MMLGREEKNGVRGRRRRGIREEWKSRKKGGEKATYEERSKGGRASGVWVMQRAELGRRETRKEKKTCS